MLLECYGVPFRWYFSFFDAMVFSYCHSILQTCFVDRVILAIQKNFPLHKMKPFLEYLRLIYKLCMLGMGYLLVCHQSFFSYIVTISKDADWCLLPVMYARDGLFIGVCHQSFFSYSVTISKGAWNKTKAQCESII
jgi:hypothetical protein